MLRAVLGEVVRDAVIAALVEQHEAEALRPVLLTRDQLAQSLGCSPATVSRLVNDGCPRVLVCETARYELAAVLEWLRGRTAARCAESGA